MYSLFDQHDYKNTLNSVDRVSVGAAVSIDNFYLRGKLVPQWPPKIGVPPMINKLARGGLQSIDGMHPTGCGYALFAALVIQTLKLRGDPELIHQSFIDDPLLHDFPLKLDLIAMILAQLRKALIMEAVPVPEAAVITEAQNDIDLTSAIRLMNQALLR
jgi:hypothetical protein